MWSAFEDFNAILLFTCHQWLGMSALCNKKRSPAFSLLAVFFFFSSFFFFFFPPLSHWTEPFTEALINLVMASQSSAVWLASGFHGARVNPKKPALRTPPPREGERSSEDTPLTVSALTGSSAVQSPLYQLQPEGINDPPPLPEWMPGIVREWGSCNNSWRGAALRSVTHVSYWEALPLGKLHIYASRWEFKSRVLRSPRAERNLGMQQVEIESPA